MHRLLPRESGLQIAAVVATRNRADLLAERALASVARQARPPDFLIVADDSDAQERPRNAEIVDAPALPATKRVYLGNYRTPGACGAWNTALAWLLATARDCFVAILDDDDAWDPTYLARCEAAVLAHGLDMAAAGLVFHKTAADAGLFLSPPESLNADDFLTGNPHIQGSNLFVRLTTLLEAGGFDEGLRSTTDRDLCIRLADLGTLRYAALAEHLVHHYAEPNRPRLSTPGTDAKRAGLAAFYRKYGARMTDGQRKVFMQRCRDRFNCDPASPPANSPQTPLHPAPDRPGGRLLLLVGAITSPDVSQVAQLMGDLITHYRPRRDLDLRVLLLENGGADAAARAALQDVIADAAGRGLAVSLIDLEQQAADRAGAVNSIRSIARSRTLLQRHLYRAARELPDAVVWIVDDDCRVDGDHALDHIKRFWHAGGEIVLGMVTGAPPLPFLSCVRTQLVDLYHNLEHLARLSPDAPYPDRGGENAAARRRNQNYYYDLSRRETSHLESPFWYEPAGATVGAVFAEMVGALPGILSGVQVFRPLVVDDSALVDPVAGALPSVHRGPTTFVFDPEALRDFPNAVPTMEDADLRRSDMVWCLLNRHAGGRRVVQAPLLVRQQRKAGDRDAGLDGDKLTADMRGYALYSCMRDVFERKVERRAHDSLPTHGPALLHFDRDDMILALGRFRKYLHERMNAFALSYFRILGLLKSFDRYINETRRADYWWLADEKYADAADTLRRFVTGTRRVYAAFDIDDFRRRIAPGNDDMARVREYLNALPLIIERHRADCQLSAEQLFAQAADFIRREFETGELRRLGIGCEGVVLTDGEMTYKYFHERGRRNKRDRGAFIAFLESQAGKWRGYATLYPIVQVRRRADETVLVYPFERGAPYAGGHLDGILQFLRECRAAGIVCNNVHPDNFIVVDGGLRLVDYGADIMPFTEDRFLRMCRRAFLMYRFHDWSDLRQVMRRALRDDDLPHLAGFAHFLRALAPQDEKAQLDRQLLDTVLAGAPAAVFDYGCGKGKLSEAMAGRGLQVTAYDIDDAVIRRCRSHGGTVRYLDAAEFFAPGDEQDKVPAQFDAVVCSLVLCNIEAPGTFDAVLADLRRLVTERGRVIVAVCNPFCTFAGDKLHRRHPPADAAYDSVFVYRKDMPATGRSRRDVHRPLHFYTRAFLRAGLVVEQVRETRGADAARLWPVSNFLVFDLRPAPLARDRVSLLIKTCYMEWRAIERLVRHKVGQLAVPGGFLEVLVVVDCRRDGFLRQYDAADPAAHHAAMRRLLDDGVVDKVIYAPEDAATVTATYRRWFGADAAETHAANGQQIFATLYGFDACRGDYVLHMDSDILIGRAPRAHDYLAEMIGVLKQHPRALFVALPVPGAAKPYTPAGRDGRPWGVDPRCGMFDRRRLNAARPLPNEVGNDGRWQLAWHRACNRFIADSDFRAYRGGDPRTFFICVPNEEKTTVDRLFRVIDRIEQGFCPPCQTGCVELTGGDLEWAGPKRNEPYIFIICGRNVEAGRFRRCFDSLLSQSETDWGAVIVDDASDNGLGDYIDHLIAPHRDRVTFIRNTQRRRTLHNTWDAIVNFCGDPQSVIVTVDADDALIGRHALARVRREYDAGADVTVGSMLRLDKETVYIPDFNNPRGNRGGNVWQHLRTFRKYLFDAIDADDLKRNGDWIDPATDWAFMLPIIEMARRPAHIPDLLYLYEPAAPISAATRREREAVIRHLVARPRYLPVDSPRSSKHPLDRNR
ncbi:MAG: glycosyltransferase [Gammaproteobacteria bacterium]|nr:glycosyltransferase [Gammaproteobacteria bacterium]